MDYLTPEMVKAQQEQLAKADRPTLDLSSPALYIAVGAVAFVIFYMIARRRKK
jgi:hypothetical protein